MGDEKFKKYFITGETFLQDIAEEEKSDALRKGIAIVRVLEYHICGNEYELKSQNGALGNKKITDGAYETMIARITIRTYGGKK